MELVASGFSIFGLTIEYYGIFMALGMLAGMLVAMRLCKHRGMDSNAIFTLAIFTLPSALIGARLYYVIFDQEVWSLKQILFTRGGFAVYGGIIGGVLAVIIYCLIKKVSIVKMFDILAPALIIGQCIGRIGCYFGGCCYGQLVINQALQWFPLSVLHADGWHYSTFFYESLWCLAGFLVLFFMFKKVKIKGLYAGLYFVYYGIGRFLIEGIRGESLYIGSSGIRVSQLLSLLVVLLGIVWLTLSIINYKKSKKLCDQHGEIDGLKIKNKEKEAKADKNIEDEQLDLQNSIESEEVKKDSLKNEDIEEKTDKNLEAEKLETEATETKEIDTHAIEIKSTETKQDETKTTKVKKSKTKKVDSGLNADKKKRETNK